MEFTTIDKISENLDGKRKPITSSDRTEGNIPYYGASGIVDYVEDYIFNESLLLISEDGANLLARSTPIAFSIEGKSWVNNHAHVLRFSNMIQQKYVELYLNHISLEAYITGSAQPKLNQKKLNEIPIPVVSEQEMIDAVVTIEKIQNIIRKRNEELEALDELIKARFVELFGTPNGNEKGFPMLTVDDVIEFTGGAQPDKKYFEYEPTEDNIRLIQIRDYKTDNYVTYIPKSMAKRFCDADDIMIGRYGPPIFQILKGIEGSYNVALMKATPKMGNREFIRYFLKQDCLFNYLDGLSQRTAGQSGIEMPALKAYPFPYPPIELQEEFETFAKQVDKSKVAVQRALDEAQLLFDSLMQKYFG